MTDPDFIPLKVIQVTVNRINASDGCILNKDGRDEREKQISVTLLNSFSNISESFLLEKLIIFIDKILSVLISAYYKWCKLHAYNLSIDAAKILTSSLKQRIQGVKINNVERPFEMHISSVPQGSLLAATHFNKFLNNIFIFITEAKLAYLADNNAIYTGIMKKLLEILKRKIEIVVT